VTANHADLVAELRAARHRTARYHMKAGAKSATA
jgi:hypothetical protein